MRTAFIQELIAQARLHPEIFLVVGDLGFSVVEPFAQEFPHRYLNAGVAEQNMTTVAAGLASEGYHVFTYSIANFPTLRCLEQIRNDVCYHELPVTVVSVGAGASYGNLGYSHHAVQDLAILRSLGGIAVLSPADPGETRECLRWLTAHPGPSYLRLGKAGEPELHHVSGIEHGLICVREGQGPIALVATGSVLKVALETAGLAAKKGFRVAVYSLPWIHPLDSEKLAALTRFRHVIALEEHLAAGGLGSALREYLPDSTVVESAAYPREILGKVGSQNYLRAMAGLSAENLSNKISRAAEALQAPPAPGEVQPVTK